MRLRELHLERYGPFTGERLCFREDAKLHVVYGPNEAGKSCSLAAITDLLFGIEFGRKRDPKEGPQPRYDFLHNAKELRLGGKICGSDRSELTFSRRKGKKGTLLDAAGNALPDDALAPFLGGLTREVFCRAFGLDAAALRASGDDLKRSDGELGASLFAAASGLRGFHDLRAALDREADAVFAPRAAKDRRFYQALDRYEIARKAIRDLELKAGDWKTLNEAIAACAARLDEIDEARARNAAEEARLSRLKRAAPILRLIDEEEAERAALGPLPAAVPGLAQALREALDEIGRARSAHEKAAAREEQLAAEQAAIAVDEALAAAAAEIERLFAETGAYAKSRADLPRVEAEARELTAELDQLALRLGLADGGAVAEGRSSDAAQALVRKLLEDGRACESEREARGAEAARERETVAALTRERAERGRLVDPAPLREKLAALAPALARLGRRDGIAGEIRAEARALQEAAARLSPPVRHLDALAAAPLPSPETIARVRTRRDDLAQAAGRARDGRDGARARSEAIAARLAALVGARPVPTAEGLAAARSAREAQWARLRATLLGAEEALAGAALTDGVASFERLAAQADRLADDMAADAERIAEHAGETRRLAAERAAERDAAQRLAEAEQALEAAAEAWRAAWAPAGIEPLSPAEMAPWLASVASLLERREALAARRDEAARLDEEAEAIRPALEALAREIDLAPIAGLDPLLAARRIEERVNLVAQGWDAARDLDLRLADAATRVERAAKQEDQALARVERWRAAWAEAAPRIGLGPQAGLAEADAALAAWKEVPGVLRERDNRASRVAGMRRDVERFETAVRALVSACAVDLAALPVDAAVKTLRRRLAETQQAQARRQEKARQIEEAHASRAESGRAIEAAERALAELSARLGGAAEHDLPDLAARLAERERLNAALKERRGQLANAADGHGEAALREALAAFDPDAAEAELARLRQADEALDREGKERFAEKDRHERRLKEFEQGVGAEIALQQRRGAEAELAEAARDYAVLKLGALLVGAALERRRSTRQDPLMERAGALFRTLTGEAFEGLAQEFDDDDAPHLAGRRASGRTVRVGDMSEGARDQLYLALRLAYLEHYAERAAPAPFVADDLFASFDDERTGHGLETLAAIGAKVQPILFTHHRHVVEIAARRLGSAVDVIELGGAPVAAGGRLAAAE